MTQERKAGIALCAAVGASIGVGIGLYRDFTPSLGWQGAMLLAMLGAAVAAAIATVLVQTIIAVAGRGKSRGAMDAADGGTPSNDTPRKPRKSIPWEAAALKP